VKYTLPSEIPIKGLSACNYFFVTIKCTFKPPEVTQKILKTCNRTVATNVAPPALNLLINRRNTYRTIRLGGYTFLDLETVPRSRMFSWRPLVSGFKIKSIEVRRKLKCHSEYHLFICCGSSSRWVFLNLDF